MRLVGRDLLQSGVFLLRLLEPLDLVHANAAVLLAPSVIGLLGDAELPTDLGRVGALRQEDLCLREPRNDLFCRVPSLCHDPTTLSSEKGDILLFLEANALSLYLVVGYVCSSAVPNG